MRRTLPIVVLLVGMPLTAHAWDPLRSTNSNVDVGNARLRANDPQGALQAYDRAARELPDEPAIQLNRGLALLAAGNQDQAREAFLAATDPDAPPSLRADAYFDLGLAFYRQADGLAGEQNHEQAQQSFREAVDAFRRSLRLRPGDRNTAWNLELALRRLREEQEQQQQDQQQQDQQQQDQQQQDQQQQDQQQQDQQQQDQQQQDQQQQDQQQQDQQQQDQQQQDQQQQDQQQQDQQQQDQQQQDQQQQDQQQQDQQQQDQQQQDQPNDGEGAYGQRLPSHVERVLDALQDDEQSLERIRAHRRAQRERRRILRDW